MKNKVLALMLTAVMVCSMAACGKDATGTDKVSTQASTETPAQSEPENTEAPDASTGTETEQTGTEEGSGELTGNEELAFDLPEGFVKNEESSSEAVTMYYGPDYPDKYSNINTNSAENDGSFSKVTAEMLAAASEQQIEAAYGIDVDIELLDDKTYEVNGCNARFYELQYEVQGSPIHQMQVILDTPETIYFVTYTDVDGGEYLDAFRASADTVRFE